MEGYGAGDFQSEGVHLSAVRSPAIQPGAKADEPAPAQDGVSRLRSQADLAARHPQICIKRLRPDRSFRSDGRQRLCGSRAPADAARRQGEECNFLLYAWRGVARRYLRPETEARGTRWQAV